MSSVESVSVAVVQRRLPFRAAPKIGDLLLVIDVALIGGAQKTPKRVCAGHNCLVLTSAHKIANRLFWIAFADHTFERRLILHDFGGVQLPGVSLA